ncbi:Uu.00g068610.m01.CDS01 [Anthostomella pinea]|uniref:Box C/D snoRNA protein 1 n=1 Tax=Anthostomella pinea TaxID=933095 RepID=A0AAI8VUE0_9PEZI|nr:Uu.00g068610.m01.CDS01 [Anthostomella pinea]
MADPLLTSLCTICRIQTPKYRCPRCGTRTCSLTCVKKHKNWSSCNGDRDATAFMPREKLKTDAGIDHDYNFLTKIERCIETAEKILRDEREILPEEKSNPPPHKRARPHKGQSRGRTTLDDSGRKWERSTIQRMRKLDINVASVPYGMTRAKENMTTWNRRTKTINWQVEWLDMTANSSAEGGNRPSPTRLLYKILDETPLHLGFAEAQEYRRQQQLSDKERAQEKALQRREELAKSGQHTKSTAWHAQPAPMQSETDSTWSYSEDHDNRRIAKDLCRFFFLKPRTPSKDPRRLVPLRPREGLATLLPGLDVVEFPTICVLPAGVTTVPDGYVIEKRPEVRNHKKRKGSALVEYGSSSEPSDGEQDEGEPSSDDDTSSSGSDSDMSEWPTTQVQA